MLYGTRKRVLWDVKSGVLVWGKPAAFVRPSDRDFGARGAEGTAFSDMLCA